MIQSTNSKLHRVIVWLRNDLRMHDNACLQMALAKAK